MSREDLRSWGKRERRRQREAGLKRILELDREGFAPQVIADAARVSVSYVTAVIEDFHRFREAKA